MMMKQGDLVYIEAITGNGKQPEDSGLHHIRGIYKIFRITRTRIWLIEQGLMIKIYKDRIIKIEIKSKD
jgi:hypothetical protein